MATIEEALAQGWKLHQAGQLAQAEQIYRQILQQVPQHGIAWCYHGMALNDLGRYEEAVTSYYKSLAFRPDMPETYNNLGNTLTKLNRPLDAIPCFQKALELRPRYSRAYHNWGVALGDLGKLAEAERNYREAVHLDPNFHDACNGVATSLLRQVKIPEALAAFDEVIRRQPTHADAHKNRGMALLMLGDFERGFPEYEWRWRCKDGVMAPIPQPLWDGSPLDGKTLLLRVEQGLGDTLQFIRFAPYVKQLGCRVVVECQKSLLPLLRGFPGVDEWVERGQPLPPCDCYLPLCSVPRLLGTRLETIPAEVPYLHARDDLIALWRKELEPLRGFRVGIAWQGSPTYGHDKWRSVPLVNYEPLARVPGVQLIGLQKNNGIDQLADIAGRFTVHNLSDKLDEEHGPFMDTAAVMKVVDLVITSDTSIAHLAGGLGVPVWVAIPFLPDWRWLLERSDSPWYPTMRLFRQSQHGYWGDVFEQMTTALRDLVAASTAPPSTTPAATSAASPGTPSARTARPVTVEVAPGELIDKITILEIKCEHITDAGKLANVRTELETLTAARDAALPASDELSRLTQQLREINQALWVIEDDIRECERQSDFGPKFIELARSVYRTNDRRAQVKRQINDLLGSRLIEEKAYAAY